MITVLNRVEFSKKYLDQASLRDLKDIGEDADLIEWQEYQEYLTNCYSTITSEELNFAQDTRNTSNVFYAKASKEKRRILKYRKTQ